VLRKRGGNYFSYGRKTGARNAQAISKVCIAGVGRYQVDRAYEVRIGIGAVAPTPLRLVAVETVVNGRTMDDALIAEARRALDAEIAPIDDIRSVATYRRWVAGNLVEEFLRALARLPAKEAAEEILPCCGSTRWARMLAQRRPFGTAAELCAASDETWRDLDAEDWDEAFRTHPRIGERAGATQLSAQWSREEQSGVDAGDAEILAELTRANADYELRFGRVFLVCATGKSAAEMLQILRRRLSNDNATELRETVEQQRQITQLRLQKWLKG
jgi:2-oxo-4-hydroxy-4-carboxy-5-ureidoimidazoline decarboxylase